MWILVRDMVPQGLQTVLPAAGMTQTLFFSQHRGVCKVGPSAAEHKRPPQLLYFKLQGLVTGLVRTAVLAGE